jgi:hypothetical protein
MTMSHEPHYRRRLLASREPLPPPVSNGLLVALLGVAIMVLVVACAMPRVFDGAPADGSSTSTGAVAGVAGATGATGATNGAAASGGDLEEVIVTGSRVHGDGSREPPQARAAQQRPLQTQSAQRMAPMATRTQPDDGGAVLGREARQSGVAGTLFSRVQPGEEIWVIETIAVHKESAAVEDDQPGSGALLALVNDQGPDRPPVEVPLPLQHTDVHAVVTGYIGSVDVTQQFSNPYN